MTNPSFMNRALIAIALIAALGTAAGAAGAPPAPASCIANVAHPIATHVTALDPIARGAIVRLRVTATSAVGVEGAEIRMTSTGGAENRGPSIVTLGSLVPGRMAQGVFTVAIPQTGGRQYLQFQVTGKGLQGRLTRGACYNALPDGPASNGRAVVTPQGARVVEFAARRIDR